MTFLVERLAELRRHLQHLRDLRPQVTSSAAIEANLTLHNDVLFSLLMVAQLTIDIAAELGARRGDRFEDYTEAVRSLSRDERFPPELVSQLERVPGFRNIVIHEYVKINFSRVVKALDELGAIERFADIVRQIEANT